ncbi:hypothetical protein ACIBL3_26475 [Kribbella sp. NPDC050124]|uniref:hypothetical protein n=1 Tax=Kribbella sp. NPDC050124 TaxID=3364114 RepID=UPI00378D36F3
MLSPKFVRRLVPAGALALLAAIGVLASPAAAGQDPVMRVSGAAGGRLGPEWPGMEGDPVRFEIDGQATDPLHPSGTFHVVHRKPDGRLLAEFSGRITSLKAVDEVAIVTGVIDAAEHPDIDLEFVGKPVAMTVYDGGDHDRIGWAWGFFGAPVSPLQGTAPYFALTDGGFRVDGGARHHGAQGNGPAVDVRTGDGTTVAAVLGGPSPTGSALRFDLSARVPAGGDATQVQGSFHFTERGKASLEGRLTCLQTGGPVAVTTGVVTRSDDPAQVGKPVSFSLKDGQVDRISWLWSWSAEKPPIADCLSTVPSYAPRWGGVVVLP